MAFMKKNPEAQKEVQVRNIFFFSKQQFVSVKLVRDYDHRQITFVVLNEFCPLINYPPLPHLLRDRAISSWMKIQPRLSEK